MHEKLLWKLTFNCENEWTCDKIDKMFTFDQLVLSISTFSVTNLIFFYPLNPCCHALGLVIVEFDYKKYLMQIIG